MRICAVQRLAASKRKSMRLYDLCAKSRTKIFLLADVSRPTTLPD